MGNEHIYCDVCGKVIPDGTTHLTVNVLREYIVPDDQCLEVDGMAESVLTCHEECIPPSVEVNLSRFANRN